MKLALIYIYFTSKKLRHREVTQDYIASQRLRLFLNPDSLVAESTASSTSVVKTSPMFWPRSKDVSGDGCLRQCLCVLGEATAGGTGSEKLNHKHCEFISLAHPEEDAWGGG